MPSLILPVGLGFILGLRHATDPDHLVAMSTLVSRSKRFGSSWLLGAIWGLGHTVTIFAVGLLIIGLKVAIPYRLGAGLEFSVGVMLFVLGMMNIAGYGLGRLGIHEHSHVHAHEGDGAHAHGSDAWIGVPCENDEAERELHRHEHSHEVTRGRHSHLHAHSPALDSLAGLAGRVQLWRSFGVGLVHGLAGSSAVALMVLAAIPGFSAEMVYLSVFGVGTLAGMMGLSTLMEAAFFFAASRFDIQRWITAGSGYVSAAFGLYIMYAIAFVGWTPH